MKKIFFLLLIILLISIITTKENNKDGKVKKKKKNKNRRKNKKVKKNDLKAKKKEEENEELELEYEEEVVKEEEDYNERYRGIYMTQKAFYKRFNEIIEERGLKNKKKITKENAKSIYEEIYKEELISDDPDSKKPKEDGQKLLDLIFKDLFKSYDYDDKININEVKKQINPKIVQDVMLTIYADQIESMGYL